VIRTLANGLAATLEQRPGIPVASVALLVRTHDVIAAAVDSADMAGADAAVADLLAEYSRDTDVAGPAAGLQAIGGSMSVTSEDGFITISGRAPSAYLTELLTAVAQTASVRLESARASQRPGDRARAAAEPAPAVLAERALRGLIHGRWLPSSATDPARASAPVLSTAAVARFHETAFRPGRAALFVVADVSPGTMIPWVTSAFGRWSARAEHDAQRDAPAGPAQLAERATPPADEPRGGPAGSRWGRSLFVPRPGSVQTTICVGVSAPEATGGNSVVLDALNAVYGGATSSRLFRRLVFEKGWAYGPSSAVRSADGRVYWVALAETRKETAAATLGEVLDLMDQLRNEPAGESELGQALRYLSGRWLMQSAMAGARLQQLLLGYRLGLDRTTMDAYPDRLRQVSAAQVLELARVVFAPERRAVVTVGDGEPWHAAVGR
jgi:zinc protease